MRQPARARRLPRRRGLGPHHRAARRPGPDPRRDSKRLDQARTSDPALRQRNRLETVLAKATKSITAMIEAYSGQLITIDEMRSRMPQLRAREAGLRAQLEAPTPRPPTATPTSSSPATWKASWPSCAARQPPPAPATAAGSSSCSSRTSSSGQRRSPFSPVSRPTPGAPGAGRATGEPLSLQGGRLTPRTPALWASHSRAWPQPCDCARCPAPCQAFPGRCHTAAGEAAGPGGAPAAKRGRTTWRCGEATATLGHEEGHRPRTIGEAIPPPHAPRKRPAQPLDTKRHSFGAVTGLGRLDPHPRITH